MKKTGLGDTFKLLDKMEEFDIEGHDPELYSIRALAFLNSENKKEILVMETDCCRQSLILELVNILKSMYHHQANDHKTSKEFLEKALEVEPDNKTYKKPWSVM